MGGGRCEVEGGTWEVCIYIYNLLITLLFFFFSFVCFSFFFFFPLTIGWRAEQCSLTRGKSSVQENGEVLGRVKAEARNR